MKKTANAAGGRRGMVFVISAPSGTGKTTLVNAVRARFPFLEQSISCTTRRPRTGEKNGRDYFFLTDEEFRHRIDEGYFFEWAEVYGHLYGTPKEWIAQRVAAGKYIICSLDVQGALAVKDLLPDDAVLVFVLPPSIMALKQRLTGRALDDIAAIERRLEEARDEIRRYIHYDYVVVNDELEHAAALLGSILSSEIHCSKRWNADIIEKMLA
ncbi:MAG TPA: guanylate kinase [bacterium]|nr:guanylate kinase [bacterium]